LSAPGILHGAREVATRELRCALRDRQTALYTLVLPVALYPLLFWLLLQGWIVVQGREEALPVAVAVVAADGVDAAALARAMEGEEVAPGPLVAHVAEDVAPTEDAARALLEARDAPPDAVLLARAGERAQLLHLGGTAGGAVAVKRAGARLRAHAETVRGEALERIGLERDLLAPLPFEDGNLATEVQMGGFVLSFLLPLMLVAMSMMGAFIPAVDATAGERERGTAETTLLAPVPRLATHLGKIAAVSCLALTAVVLNLAGMGLAIRQLVAMLPVAKGALPVGLPVAPLLAVLPFALLFVVFTSSVLVAVASTARTFKQGQATLGTMQILFLAPALAGALPGLELTPGLAAVPVLQVVLVFKSLLQGLGSVDPTSLVVAAVTLVGWTVLAVALAVRVLSSEEAIASDARISPLAFLRMVTGRREAAL
jgi:sodium transport system permease protein